MIVHIIDPTILFLSIHFRFFIPLCLLCGILSAQEAHIVGKIIDENGLPLVAANISVEDLNIGTSSNLDGEYHLLVPADKNITVVYSYLGYQTIKRPNLRLGIDQNIRVDITLSEMELQTQVVLVEPFEKREIDALHVEKKDLERIPVTDGNLTSLIKYLAPGVTAGTGGELTSQYSVRGGNYDENLVYVNGFEIYRPLLVRSGQQEGLVLPNADMLNYLSFSAGGFKAQYGDKMASVLDVNYRRPHGFEASVGGSLLGGSVYVGGAAYRDSLDRVNRSPQRFTYTIGARYKTTSYLLSSLDVKGEYVPQFYDLQSNLIYDISKNWQIEFLGHYSNSIYRLTPQESSTTTGLFNQALRLTTLFEGREISNFENFTTATSVTYLPYGLAGVDEEPDSNWSVNRNLKIRLLASHFQTNENERIDIINFYRLDEIETGIGEENFGDVVGTLAYGETHQFARNFLQANVTNIQLRGTYTIESIRKDGYRSDHWFKWGLGYKNEQIKDKLKEWTRLDSLGFTLPADTSILFIPQYTRTSVSMNTHRFNAFLQHTWEMRSAKHLFRMTTGVRANYWTWNNEWLVSPRVQMYYTPRKYKNNAADSTKKTKDLTFKLAAGLYYQPPFYRELRDFEGNIGQDVLAQKSLHVLGGIVWDFMMLRRKFKFITEAYYKHQWDLIPYDIDNVRVRYFGDNIARGYVTGIDLRLNGELIDGLESWINLSILRARERFDNVEHGTRALVGTSIDTTYLADVPKATDQLVIFSMYFQDNFPKAEWAQLSLAFTVGSGLPFGIPGENVEFRNTYRFSPYHRVDLAASFGLWDRATFKKKKFDNDEEAWKARKHPLRFLRGIWLSFEVFNLMDVRNVAANTWVKDFTNRSYAIPNNLTSRRLNVRFKIDF